MKVNSGLRAEPVAASHHGLQNGNVVQIGSNLADCRANRPRPKSLSNLTESLQRRER
jgi:hypothetical protein